MYGIRKRHLATIAFLLFPIIVTLLPDSAKESVKSRISRVLKFPIICATVASSKIGSAFAPKGFFLKTINQQHVKIEELKAQNSQVQEIIIENQRLNDILSFKKDLAFKVSLARVIARDPSNWRHTIIIDKGSSVAIKKNMFIISQRGLAGRICEVGRSTSKAILMTDPDFRVAAVVQRSREQMIAAGRGSGLCELKYITEGADIQFGDIIVTSGFGGFCPKGVLIGEVVSVGKSVNGVISGVYVKPAAHLSRLEEILVLLE